MKKISIVLFYVLCTGSVFAQDMDIDLLRKINIKRNRNLDDTFYVITNSTTPVSIAVPVVVMGIGFIKRDSLFKNKGACIGASMLLAAGVSTGMKYLIDRPRPYKTYPEIEKVTAGGSPSFPSGHTSDAFATATALSLEFPKWFVVAPSYLWACSVGYSRMHLGVHYPSDVIGGAIVGAGSAFVCYKVNRWLHKRKGKR